MPTLKSLKLSNIRRFAENVQIDLSPGVNILYAPNGTGKTAVIEAIELALTEEVARLNGTPGNLIRDGGPTASVTLDFGSWRREVKLSRSGEVTVVEAGSLAELFPDAQKAAIPNLLRLTHLLDQRDSNWFCQRTADEAGEQLSYLPIARDALKMQSAIGKAKPAFTRLVNDQIQRVEDCVKTLDRWEALLQTRIAISSSFAAPLLSLEQINNKLSDLIDVPAITGPVNKLSLTERIGNGLNIVRGRSDSAQRRVVELVSQTGTPERFDGTQASIISLQQRLAVLSAEAELLSSRRSLANIERQRISAEKMVTFARRSELKSRIDLKTEFDVANETTATLSSSFEANEVRLAKMVAQYEQSALIHKTVVEKKTQSEALSARRGTLLAEENALRSERARVASWKEAIGRAEVATIRLKDFEAESTIERERLEAKKAEHLVLRTAYLHSVQAHEAASNTSNSIRAAIATISTALPPGTEKCPVCDVHHGEVELRRRLDQILNSIDPQILSGAERVAQTKRDVERSESELSVVIRMIEERDAQEQTLRSAAALIQDEIAALSNSFPDTKVDEAATLFIQREMTLKSALEAVTSQIQAAGAPTSEDDIAEGARHLRELSATIETEREQRRRDTSKLSLLRTEIIARRFDPVRTVDLEQLQSSLEQDDATVSQLDEAERAANATDAELTASLLGLGHSMQQLQEQLAMAEASVQGLSQQWLNLGLPPALTEQFLEAAISEQKLLTARNNELEHAIKELSAELERNILAEQFLTVQKDIDEACGSLSEPEHYEKLKREVQVSRELLDELNIKRATLDTLSKNLATSLNDVRAAVQKVVPQWQLLIRRIVRNNIFDNVSLSYSKKFNRNHAQMDVPLGGADAAIADLASQAQMTDLQLSFLLAMASVHKWSPWKALLLDDPTQHHDLVNAAGVFDVIREYAGERGFQILLTSHDALQTKFLTRKLINDDVPVAVWRLQATDKGVVAEKETLIRAA